ncbi:MAG: DUF4112 domain-containing protein [Phormidesmis sp.]
MAIPKRAKSTDSSHRLPPSSSHSQLNSAAFKRLRQMSHLLDNAIAIPGTNYRFGLDPILGLLPGGGDVLTGFMSVYIVFEAARMGLPAPTIGRMGFNILLDTLTGLVPVLGDVFDVAWKANSQNVALLEKHIASPEPSQAADKIFAFAVIIALLALVLGIAALSVWVVVQLATLLNSLAR